MEKAKRIEDILASREKRKEIINSLAEGSDVVTVKANIPGENKNLPEALLTVTHFTSLLTKHGIFDTRVHTSPDGMWTVSRINDGKSLKESAVLIEEEHPIGRFVDIDVTLKNALRSLSRNSMRKCFICDLPAFVCRRGENHTQKELVQYLSVSVRGYFKDFLTDTVFDSMMRELCLENKFGLVSKSSRGSHTDLDFVIMKRASEVVSKSIVDCFFV